MKRLIPISMFVLGAMLMASQVTTADSAGTILGAAEMDSFVGACGPCKNPGLVDAGCEECIEKGTKSQKCTQYQDGKNCLWNGWPTSCAMTGSLICSNDTYEYDNQDCLGLPTTLTGVQCTKPAAVGDTCQ